MPSGYFYTGENEQLKRNADLMREKLKSHEQVSLCIFIFNQIPVEHLSSQIRKKRRVVFINKDSQNLERKYIYVYVCARIFNE